MAYPLSHLHSSQLSVNNGCREKRKKERKRGWKRTDRIKDRRVKRKKSQRTDVTRWIGWGDVERERWTEERDNGDRERERTLWVCTRRKRKRRRGRDLDGAGGLKRSVPAPVSGGE